MDTQPEINITETTEENKSRNSYHTDTNVYPAIRTIILSVCVLIALSVVIFLIYQNGKSIYANGI